MKPFLPPVFSAALAVALVACGGKPAVPAASHGAPSLATLTVAAGAGSGQQHWDGIVEAVDAAVLAAQTNARVLALPHDVGDTVKRGEVLVRFSDVEQQSAARAAQAQIAAAKAAWVEAEANYKRYAAIYPQGYVSRAAYEQALAQRNSAKAQLDAAQQQWRSAGAQQDYTVVRAPFDGVVTKRYVQVGEAVAGPPFPQQLIAIASLAQLRVEARLPQAVAEALRRAGRAEVLADDGKRIAASRLTVFPVADPATHTVAVRLELPAGVAGLYPGMAVKLAFAGGAAATGDGTVSVPVNALVRRGELTGVYVVDGDAVSLRQLRIGDVRGDRATVLAGLAPGEHIAADPDAAARWLIARRGAGAP
ncbi:efflux RND transporter periplasmic adaptor subunit [Rhodanobacter sp. PCA2]|uniref:efflux RND transporter periplasmic adaptor subunit n=1 Tax=Rhodanobacter sp. PCA2 TaxID=2006117 RepID=UPI0031B8818A